MKQTIILTALVVGFLSLGLAVHYQQTAINSVIWTQWRLMEDYEALSRDIQQLRRENTSLPERVEKIEHQMDLVTAATRAGWGQAYKLVRSGVFE